MPIWPKSTFDAYYPDKGMDSNLPCEVRINGDEIVVSYRDDFRKCLVVWKGHDEGNGHYVLEAPTVKGRATLHMNSDHEILDGWYIEDRRQGMWRFTLDE